MRPPADRLFDRVAAILETARAGVVRAVNSHMVLAYWHIGREIVQSLQRGGDRAEYGRRLMDDLALRLTRRYGRGFSTTNLRYFRSFHQVYADRVPKIRHIAGGESRSKAIRHATGPDAAGRGFSPRLGWSHYRTLMAVEHRAARLFYEIEAEREGWSVGHLERQVDTLLFARLLRSRNKAGLLQLARAGQDIRRPVDALRDPYVLDFLDLPDGEQLHESSLEAAIIHHLQAFLLELGKGFAFVARQKRLAYDDEHFYVDLVFYHTVLKCYLLVDLKIGRLSHQDIGQMDSYVRLFDEQYTVDGDNPTIGLILCAEKNEAIAKYSVLAEGRQIFAAKYLKYLPTETELKVEIERERTRVEARRTAGGKKRD
jgi:predicted nuclease of restriction endonuclease-like (RecB) superfamily